MRVSGEVQQQVVALSQTETCRAIAVELGIHRTTVERILRQHGVELRRGPRPTLCNNEFFSTYRPESCYWGGMLLADGYIRLDRPVVDLHLKSGDVGHVRKFATAVEYGGTVHAWETDCRVTITSVKMTQDLGMKFGVVPRKTAIAEFPAQVPEEQWSHLVRGIFDGDGCITYPKGAVPAISFVGTPRLLEGIRTVLSGVDGVSIVPPVIGLSDITSCIGYSGKNAKAVCDWMYSDSEFGTRLDRKYQRYVDWFKGSYNG